SRVQQLASRCSGKRGPADCDSESVPQHLATHERIRHFTTTNGRSFSTVFGPMPFTRSRSLTLWNGELARAATIACAVTGPIPGGRGSPATLAVFALIGGSPS